MAEKTQQNAGQQPIENVSKMAVQNNDLERQPTVQDYEHPGVERTVTGASTHDIGGTVAQVDSYVETNAAQYERFSPSRKIVITAVLSLCGFLSPVSSTTVLSAIPEIAQTFDTTGTIINISNACYLVSMGISPCVWGPMSQIYGRRWICVISAVLFTAFSIGTALAPNLASFFVFRVLTAFQGTSFLIVGTSCIGDIYTPTTRGTALSWFLSGALIGPCLAPLLGGVIVTYTTWRVIFWMQTGLGGLATILVMFLLPETIPSKNIDELADLPRKERTKHILHLMSPLRVIFMLVSYPNLIIAGLASSSLVFNMYSLLTPVRYVLNPRFHLTSPIQSGLFFIAPGCGYLFGTFFGGRFSDYIVKRYIAKRGRRVSEDRLRACLAFMGVVIPICMLIYGWSVEKRVGGVPLPVAAMFIQGVAQLFCFPSLNTYCVDVMQSKGQGGVVIAGNYMIRYMFAALGSAICLPAVEAIGVGWFSTISALFLVVSAVMVWTVTVWGEKWRHEVNEKKARHKAERHAKSENESEHS